MPRFLAAARRVRRFPRFASAISPGPFAWCDEQREFAAVTVPMSAVFPDGPIRLGSEEHKILFCRTLLDTFNPYKPAVIDWPSLDTETRNRLVELPICDI